MAMPQDIIRAVSLTELKDGDYIYLSYGYNENNRLVPFEIDRVLREGPVIGLKGTSNGQSGTLIYNTWSDPGVGFYLRHNPRMNMFNRLAVTKSMTPEAYDTIYKSLRGVAPQGSNPLFQGQQQPQQPQQQPTQTLFQNWGKGRKRLATKKKRITKKKRLLKKKGGRSVKRRLVGL